MFCNRMACEERHTETETESGVSEILSQEEEQDSPG